ncbi:unnamed protein product [Oikopleura dioica]|uniref:Calponin-homology (CH) domain-containing protein n=1 Tax=Oikopleura dioica TaxID=34765 RepID=E4WQ28_OIKDI|nr:unnamed protein product [Oikopleura dioica]CBY35313.1 unnamed protein product [Oikopleura dioica]
MSELDDDSIKSLLKWIDTVPLSREKKSLARDFSDGVLAAEIIRFYFPRMVELHNYQNASSRQQKLTNWNTLNRKVLSKFGFVIPQDVLDNIIKAELKDVQLFLFGLRRVIEDKLKGRSVADEGTQNYYEVGNYNPNYNANKTTGVPAQQTRRKNPGKMHSNKKSGGRSSGTNTNDNLSLTLRAGVPLSELNLQLLDTDTKLVLAEKEQALLASHETIKVLQLKISRLEQLLALKDKRIQELKKQVELPQNL